MTYAENFRIPYWDWARGDTQIVPEQALDSDYNVDGPPSSASTGKDYNPLFAYPFAEGTSPDITVGAQDPSMFMATTAHSKFPGVGQRCASSIIFDPSRVEMAWRLIECCFAMRRTLSVTKMCAR
jgi:hypothetical protein